MGEKNSATGTVIGERYRIEKLLATASSGRAYLAWDSMLKRRVVLRECLTEPESESAKDDKNPQAAKMYGHFEADGSSYLVLEYREEDATEASRTKDSENAAGDGETKADEDAQSGGAATAAGRLREKKMVLPIVLIAVLFCAVLFGLSRGDAKKESAEMRGQADRVVVGNYVNADFDAAKENAKAQGIELTLSDTKNDDAEEGTILEQSVEAGKKVREGTEISVVVSAGNQKTRMPNWVGFSKKKAEKAAKEKGISVTIEESVASNIKKGYVVAQDKTAGEKIPKESAVALTISQGRDDIDTKKTDTLPELLGKTLEEVLKLAEEKEFYVAVKEYAHSQTYPEGTVSEQSKKKGAKFHAGDTVTLTISTGPEQVKMPSVLGKTLEEAKRTLEEAKLACEVTYGYSDEHGEGTVTEQSVKAGATVDAGTKVTLTVSVGMNPGSETTK